MPRKCSCSRLSDLPEEKAAGRWYCLPSEAQWEYACQAGSVGRFCFSAGFSGYPKGFEEERLLDYAWFADNSGGRTHTVGGKRPNAWGLYDMHGNVSQWCQDWYDKDYYSKSPTDDPRGAAGGANRIRRGEAWLSTAGFCRSTFRSINAPEYRGDFVGIRVAMILHAHSGQSEPQRQRPQRTPRRPAMAIRKIQIGDPQFHRLRPRWPPLTRRWPKNIRHAGPTILVCPWR